MNKPAVKRLVFATCGLLVLLLALSPVGSLFAQPPGLGHGFYGAVKVDGVDADAGTVVSAQVDGTTYDSFTVTDPGRYALIVQGDIEEGATIDFYVDGQKADQTFAFRDGWTTELDLTAPRPPDKEDPPSPPSPFPFPLPCFIATAAYGSPTAEQIDVLRDFRNVVLLESTLGSRFVAWYYRTSPPVAEFIAGNEGVRLMVREFFVDPLVWLVKATGTLWQARS